MSGAMRTDAKTASGAVAPAPRNICIRPLAFFVIICSCHVRRLRRGGRDQDKGALQAPTCTDQRKVRPRHLGPAESSTTTEAERWAHNGEHTLQVAARGRGKRHLFEHFRRVAAAARARGGQMPPSSEVPGERPQHSAIRYRDALSRLSSMLLRQRRLCQDSWCAYSSRVSSVLELSCCHVLAIVFESASAYLVAQC